METVLRAAVAYWVLLFALRITGRRSGKRLTPFEILLIFLLGGQMTQAILADDRSLTNAVTGVSTVALMHAAVAGAKLRWMWLAKIVDGTPMVVFKDGELYRDRMNMVRISEEDIRASLREDGELELEKVKLAVVERNGAISIIEKEG
jgi:uncharacterized membrane protein YcaP (DUF421 family)